MHKSLMPCWENSTTIFHIKFVIIVDLSCNRFLEVVTTEILSIYAIVLLAEAAKFRQWVLCLCTHTHQIPQSSLMPWTAVGSRTRNASMRETVRLNKIRLADKVPRFHGTGLLSCGAYWRERSKRKSLTRQTTSKKTFAMLLQPSVVHGR